VLRFSFTVGEIDRCALALYQRRIRIRIPRPREFTDR
jgi:hypothetical protein